MADLAKKKRKKKRGNRAFEDDFNPEFQVAPMADLLFVLLVFFMSITTVEVLRTKAAVDLPVAKDSTKNKQKSHQAVLNVTWSQDTHSGAISVDDKPYAAPEQLVPLLSGLLAADPVLRVLIRADRDCEYSYISAIMKACSQAQISNITFAVLDKPKAK